MVSGKAHLLAADVVSPTTYPCPVCGENRVEQFYPQMRGRSRKTAKCKRCHAEAMRDRPPAERCSQCGLRRGEVRIASGHARCNACRYVRVRKMENLGEGRKVGRNIRADDNEDWRTKAACRSFPEPDLFFAADQWRPGRANGVSDVEREEIRAAMERVIPVCVSCSVRATCLAYAMRQEGSQPVALRTGIWGGLTTWERSELWKQRAKGFEQGRLA